MTAKIKLNAASGGGSFSLQAPSSSSNNRVFTLPDVADGTIATTATGGKLVNYAQTFKTDVSFFDGAAGVVSGDLIYIDYAAASSSNKLLIMATICVSAQNGASNQTYGYLYIGGSVSAAIGDADGNRIRTTFQNQNFNDYQLSPVAHNYLLSSPSTSSTRYSYRFSHQDGSDDRAIMINKSHVDTNTNGYGRNTSSITIMEFAP